MKNNILKIADKFPYPGSRYKRLGPQSGEEFKDYLYKSLERAYGKEFNKNLEFIILIDLDGTQGYGSSFLEEGFGGLIRAGVPYKLVKSLKIKTEEEPELYEEIQEYIDDAYNKL
ncbi:MAG: STAS-like domain-containing protein [Hafnia sp.]|uniref:STAS-like domain-containing protein n=1 Tax=Hafnia sp. TaxID=1873498 RepID=UPI002FCADA73